MLSVVFKIPQTCSRQRSPFKELPLLATFLHFIQISMEGSERNHPTDCSCSFPQSKGRLCPVLHLFQFLCNLPLPFQRPLIVLIQTPLLVSNLPSFCHDLLQFNLQNIIRLIFPNTLFWWQAVWRAHSEVLGLIPSSVLREQYSVLTINPGLAVGKANALTPRLSLQPQTGTFVIFLLYALPQIQGHSPHFLAEHQRPF